MHDISIKIQKCADALDRLNLALQQPKNSELIIDGSIKRFEFTYEMFRKTLSAIIQEQGVAIKASIFEEAFHVGLLEDSDIWQQMREDRNNTSHEYNEEKAAEIFSRIPSYAKEFELVLERVRGVNA